MMKTPLSSFCPFCFGPTANSTNLWGDKGPKSGDYGLCKFCGEISVFVNKGTRLKKPSIKEQHKIAVHPGCMALKASFKGAHH